VTGINNTIIGANVTGLASTLSNRIIIADGSGNQRIYVDNTGNVGIGTTAPTAKLHLKDGHIRSEGTAPAITITSGFGGYTATLVSGSTNTKGTIIVTTGGVSANGVVRVTFNAGDGVFTINPTVVISPAQSAAVAVQGYISTVTTTYFEVGTLVVGGTISFTYIVIE
jgi:hypothetical protein